MVRMFFFVQQAIGAVPETLFSSMPTLRTYNQVVNNQVADVFTLTEDIITQGEYTTPPPAYVIDWGQFSLTGNGAPISGSFSYTVTASTSQKGMGCRVDYQLDLVWMLVVTATLLFFRKKRSASMFIDLA